MPQPTTTRGRQPARSDHDDRRHGFAAPCRLGAIPPTAPPSDAAAGIREFLEHPSTLEVAAVEYADARRALAAAADSPDAVRLWTEAVRALCTLTDCVELLAADNDRQRAERRS